MATGDASLTPEGGAPPATPVLHAGLSGYQYWKERVIETALLLSALSSVLVTLGIVFMLVTESVPFFTHVNAVDFLTGTEWAPQFEPPSFGILPLVAGTLVTTAVALAVALPIGTIVAIYLSEFAPVSVREFLKPVLELLSAVPTVVYGFFALSVVTPMLQGIFPNLGQLNMLSAGIVMGIMIIPYVSSLSEDAMRAVPMSLREAAYALGANKIVTAFKVVYPSALSGVGAAYILAISRAVGETMIVALAAGLRPQFTFNPGEDAATLTAFIVNLSGGDIEHGSVPYQSIFAAGLVLFVLTLFFNIAGYILRRRYRQAY